MKLYFTHLFFALLFTTSILYAKSDIEECNGPYKGKTIESQVLTRIIDDHRELIEWINSNGAHSEAYEQIKKDERYANLCGSLLAGAYLEDAELGYANLEGVNLAFSNLKGADLKWTNLKGAILGLANLEGADLVFANLKGADLQKVNLKDAFMGGTNLEGVNLREANLEGARIEEVFGKSSLKGVDLIRANLEGAYLQGVNLEGADLIDANLKGADLVSANLKGADLGGANLEGADLRGANLEGADLYFTNLEGADFSEAVLRDVNLSMANLKNTNFELSMDSDLTSTKLHNLRNLKLVRFEALSNSVVELRNEYRKAGMRQEERDVTYAIKHRERELLLEKEGRGLGARLESFFMYIAFEATTEWGRRPGRALQLLLWSIVFFSFFYLVSLQAPEKAAAIWRIRPKERLLDVDADDPQEVRELVPFNGFWRSIPYALYFSLLSAFHFGWRDLNVGNWIVRLQLTESTFRATGWVRIASGIQSLLCVYLLAIWALTYFGRPFE